MVRNCVTRGLLSVAGGWFYLVFFGVVSRVNFVLPRGQSTEQVALQLRSSESAVSDRGYGGQQPELMLFLPARCASDADSPL